jgi:hypothetical protein
MTNADIRASDFYDPLDFFRMHAAAAVVNVNAVRLVMRHGNFCA